jgi:hypothetical protein
MRLAQISCLIGPHLHSIISAALFARAGHSKPQQDHILFSLFLSFSSMQPDSHRQHLDMPCRNSTFWRCSRADEMPASLPNPTSAPIVKDWRKVRRSYLRGLRKQTRTVILLLALMQVCRLAHSGS